MILYMKPALKCYLSSHANHLAETPFISIFSIDIFGVHPNLKTLVCKFSHGLWLKALKGQHMTLGVYYVT